MSIESEIRNEFRARHKAKLDFAALDAELRSDNSAFSELRINLHESEFECEQRLAMWYRLNPLYQRAIVTMSFYLGIDTVIARGVHSACQAVGQGAVAKREEVATAIEAMDFVWTKRVAAMLRTEVKGKMT